MDELEIEIDNGITEVVEKDTPEVEVEVVEDTPAIDRGKQPISDVEPTEEELAAYSGKVKQRIARLNRGYHDERRMKEAAARERDEALRFAKAQMDLAKQLQKQLEEGSKQLIETSTSAADSALEAAKRKYREAYDAGDGEKMAEVQAELASAQYRKEQAKGMKPLQFEEAPVYSKETETPSVPRPSDKAMAWQSENDWFGQDDEMTSFALGYHQKLVKEGVVPDTDEYYNKVNTRMKQVFPDQFGSKQIPEEVTPPRAQKADSIVAPATRSTSPKKVTLTATAVALAKRLGITPEQYAVELAKLGGK